MADRTLVQDQLKMLYSIVQVSDHLAFHVCGKSFMAHIRVLNNLTFTDRLQQEIGQKSQQHRLMTLTSSRALS
jgi:hypothetical protein